MKQSDLYIYNEIFTTNLETAQDNCVKFWRNVLYQMILDARMYMKNELKYNPHSKYFMYGAYFDIKYNTETFKLICNYANIPENVVRKFIYAKSIHRGRQS